MLLAAAAIAALVWRPPLRRVGILACSLVILLPWIPLPIPDAFLAWAGPLRLWVWIGLAIALAVPLIRGHALAAVAMRVRDPRRAPQLAALIAGVLYLFAAVQLSPRLPSGDEPHYLVIAQSLLRDHDLKIENNHQRGDYRAYYDADLKPDYRRRGRDGQIYSIHAPGLPAIVLPVFALFGYPGAVVLLALTSAAATGVAWLTAWKATGDVGASWFGWAAIALSVPFLFQSFVVYPDALAAAIVICASLAMLAGRTLSRRRLFFLGAALALLPWLHTRYSILAVALAALVLMRNAGAPDLRRRAAALLAIPTLSAIAWFGFFFLIYGTPNPAAPYGRSTQSAAANLPRGIVGLLFDQQFGIAFNAPVYLCAVAGLFAMLRRSPRLAFELFLLVVPYGIATAAYQMWWGGFSSPARFLVPIVLPLTIPAAVWFVSSDRTGRLYGHAALVVSLLIAGTLAIVDSGGLVYNVRDGAAKWLLWASPLVNLTTGVPSAFQNPPVVVVRQALVWVAAVGLALWFGRLLARRGPDRRGYYRTLRLSG